MENTKTSRIAACVLTDVLTLGLSRLGQSTGGEREWKQPATTEGGSLGSSNAYCHF